MWDLDVIIGAATAATSVLAIMAGCAHAAREKH